MYKNVLFIAIIVFFSCKDSSRQRYTQEQINMLHLESTKVLTPNTDSIKKIDLNPFLGKKEFQFGELVQEVKIIPLETTDKSLVGRIYKIITTDEYVYIMDNLNRGGIIIFDKKGKFVKRFTQGQGPGELSRLYDIDFDFKNDELVAYQHSFLLFFDEVGNFLRQERLPLGFDNIVVTDNGYIFKTSSQGNQHLKEKEKYTFLFSDKSFKINLVAIYNPKPTQALSAYTYLYKNEDLISLTGQMTDTIYKYNSKTNELLTDFVLDYDKKLPRKYIYGETFEVFDKAVNNNDYYFNIGEYLESFSHNIFYLRNSYIGLRTVVYRDKNTGNMVGGVNANYNAKEIPSIAFPIAVYQDYFVSMYIPSSKDYEFLKDSKMISQEDKEKIKQCQDEDNPVLVYFKLKAF